MIEYLRKKIIWIVILAPILIVLAFGLGLCVKNWPLIAFDNEFKITDVLSISFSILLALLIPFYIKYFIEKGNKVSQMVLNEIERYRDHLELTHNRVFSIYQSGKISDANKSELNVFCEMLDSKFEILSTILKKRCKDDSTNLINELQTNQIELWRILTGIEINSSQITEIHPNTFVKEVKCHQNLTNTIMQINLLVTEY